MSRPREPRIVRLETHPRESVSLTVAAEYLQLHEQTVRARIEDGSLRAYRDGRRYWIPKTALAEYEARRLSEE
jgi:excisionase family DNA binding protein